ncbi:ATP-binding protein [Streptomyces sp. NPDC048638]|uniref:ATP-binding protein n=1 Tax=Streptomyces sp. NPDC048638 TaxID=3365580 RepID=UPI0037196537
MSGSWGLPVEAAEALEAVAGELVANAVEHSDSRFIAVGLCGSRAARVAGVRVTDEGPGGASVPEKPSAEQEHGRGLLIVQALAERWGQRKGDDGHTVWAEIAVGP